jgi:hypothetical protein
LIRTKATTSFSVGNQLVIDTDRCELMGAVIEPWPCRMAHLAVRARDLWIWRLDDIERPSWLPDGDFDLDSLSDD